MGSGGLVGREAELAVLRGVLDRSGTGGTAAVVVRGDAGIGKTALLEAVVADATERGWRSLTVRGIEAESVLAYAGLLAAVQPLREHVADLPPAQARALTAALGWGETGGAGGDRFLVGAAVLSLLAAAAVARPLLVAIDDIQWVDRESVEALLFAVRRLGHDPVALVATHRLGQPPPPAADGLDSVTVEGLPPAAVHSLLGRGYADGVVARLTAETGGNPLALRECGRTLTLAQRAGAATLPAALPVPERLSEAYARELAALAPDGWRTVLLVAVSGDEAAAPIVTALVAEGLDPEACLVAASDVVALTGGVLRFRHPLLRSEALRRATDAERRAAHRTLAGTVTDRAARAWHRAEATVGFDDDLAAELAAVAERDRSRRGYAAAAVAVEWAARLTSEPTLAAARLAAATDDAYMAGDDVRVRRLATEVLNSSDVDSAARARVLGALGLLEQFGGTYARAAELLEQATTLATGRALLRTLTDLGHIYYNVDDPAGMDTVAARAAAWADTDDPEQAMLAAYITGAAHIFRGRPDVGGPLVRRAIDLLETDLELRDDPRHLVVAFFAAGWLMDPGAAQAYADRRLARAREVGAFGVLVTGLTLAAGGFAWQGDHARAYATAGEAVELLTALGRIAEPGIAYSILAAEYAGRGLHDEARRALDRSREIVAVSGVTGTPPHLGHHVAYCALCRGDLDEVVAVLEEQIERHAGIGWQLEPLGVAPDLIEAYLGLGREADARDLAERFAAAQPPQPYAHVAAMVARCQALVMVNVEDAAEAFGEALHRHAAAGVDRLAAARTRLMFGMRLRRAGRRIDARAPLHAARAEFLAMDQTLWARRAADELAGTGERARGHSESDRGPLTSQETRVALLVAKGMTNKEVAASLFLSPKTVEHHLGAVLRKRGLRSRTELARALVDEAARER